MKDYIKRGILVVSLIITFFAASYIFTNIYIQQRNEKQDIQSIDAQNAKTLSGNTVVSLYKGDNLEEEKTLDQIKKELQLEDDITEEVLSKALQSRGYQLDEKSGNEILYKREVLQSVEPNKYYIREYQGYLAIYKSDDSGQLKIEDLSKDVFKGKKKFSDLPEGDKQMINNLELVYTSKEDAILDITDIIS